MTAGGINQRFLREPVFSVSNKVSIGLKQDGQEKEFYLDYLLDPACGLSGLSQLPIVTIKYRTW
jgi:hypothetical protein